MAHSAAKLSVGDRLGIIRMQNCAQEMRVKGDMSLDEEADVLQVCYAMGCNEVNTETRVGLVVWSNLIRHWKQQVHCINEAVSAR